jgi:predicted nucleotidyltransferase
MTMHPLIAEKQPEIALLCQRFGVTRLEIVGSAIGDDFAEEHSNFDFLVDFELPGDAKALDVYFGLKEGLEALLGRPVDLVMPSALRNPYFRAEVDRQQQPLYGT